MQTAKLVKSIEGWRGDASLYKLSVPLQYEEYNADENSYELKLTEYVVVSAVCAYSGPETYIFPATDKGEVTSWSEQEGSFRGGLDHTKALQGAGYEVEA